MIEDYLSGSRTFTLDAVSVGNEFRIVDLPIDAPLPAGLGGAALARGDFLAIELATGAADGGIWDALGVEFYESLLADVPTVLGATISP